jgi:hypothetical protein
LSYPVEIDVAMAATRDGHRYILGPQTQAFEQALVADEGIPYTLIHLWV